MAAPLVDRSTGDVIPASDHNDVKDYIEDGTYRVNTLSLEVGSVEVIDSNRYVIPARIKNPSASGLSFYDSAGTTEIAKLDENGNLLLKGGVGSL
ncbi:MAG: hypothetical protein ABH870_03365 [bacterium]